MAGSRGDRVAKRRVMFEQRLAGAQVWREKAAHLGDWLKAALDGVPATPDGAARRAAREAVEDAIGALEALERDAARRAALVGGVR